MADSRAQQKEIPLTGKFWAAEPAGIGQNFRTLKNLRYADTHVRGVAGMTKINATAVATYPRFRNAYHFRKFQPAESHVLAQVYTTAETTAVIIQNTAAIPGTAAFAATSLWSDSAGFGRGYFCDAPDGQMVYANGVDTCIWGGNETQIGAFVLCSVAMTAISDTPASPKDLTEQIKNTKTDSENIATCGGTHKTFIVGSTRPASGATFYFATVNATANTLTVSESVADDWDALVVTSDGTRTGGTKSFAQNGKITWASTVATTKPLYLEGYYLYWYQFTIDDGTADISHITLDCPFQPVIDLWDGVYRTISAFFAQFTVARNEDTLKVLEDDYYESSTTTYSNISGLQTATGYLELGFTEKQTGIYFKLPSDYVNVNAAVATVSYWNGTAYASVGTIADGTDLSGASMGKTGVISWKNADVALEQRKQYNNSAPLYYYKVSFDATLDASVRLNLAAGIPVTQKISHYRFPVFAQGRVLLCSDMAGDKNKALVSSKFMPQVYNGADSVAVYFGEGGELTCGTELFSLFGNSLYSLIFMFKDTETWVVAGTDISVWEDNTYLLSNTIGCPAPLTLKTINLAAEPGAGINRMLAIWQGANGIYMSDGRAPIPIHGDIKEFFDKTDSRCINASKVGDSVGWVDSEKNEYHWLFASGTAATTLNKEWVYDIVRNKWFEIDRGSDLQCGLLVHDTNGNSYNYGFLDTGYMERLEYGTTFDGTDITHTFEFGDMALGGLAFETLISAIRLLMVSKSTTTNNVTLTHTGNTGTVTSDVAAVGTITMGGVPATAETFTIDTQAFVWATARTSTGTVAIGANATACAANIATAIAADMTAVSCSAATAYVYVTAATAGVLGNAVVFTESCTNMAMDGSGVLGGTTAGADSEATTFTMSPTKTGYRVTAADIQDKLVGDPYHSLKFEMTTNDETIGFEPLAVVVTWHPTHQQ
jgi:hypothetical protein